VGLQELLVTTVFTGGERLHNSKALLPNRSGMLDRYMLPLGRPHVHVQVISKEASSSGEAATGARDRGALAGARTVH
jgi:hypothetical protein